MAAPQKKPKKDSGGAPGWMATFADLMSLLLCFFVLLLSFSEIDAAKFKQTSGSLKMAFGVQRDERFDVLPMGTSIVATEYSPGAQQLMDFDILSDAFKGTDANNLQRREEALLIQDMKAAHDNLVDALEKVLKDDLQRGELELLKLPDHKVMIRIQAEKVFHEDSVQLNRSVAPTLVKITRAIKGRVSHIGILGHTSKKSVPPSYKSNWDYSTQMAASLTEAIVQVSKIEPEKFLVMGHGDTRPVNPEAEEKDQNFLNRIEMVLIPDHNLSQGKSSD